MRLLKRKPKVEPSQAHLLRGGISASHLDLDFHARAEPVEDRHKAIDGEPPEVRVTNAREIGRRNARATVCRAHRQVFPIKRLNDFGGQDGLELFSVGVLVPQIAENIRASLTNPGFSLFIAACQNP